MWQGLAAVMLFVVPMAAWALGLGRRGAPGPGVLLCGVSGDVSRTLDALMMLVGVGALWSSLAAAALGETALRDGLLVGAVAAQALLLVSWIATLRSRAWALPEGVKVSRFWGRTVLVPWSAVASLEPARGPWGLQGVRLRQKDGASRWIPGRLHREACPELPVG